MSPKEKFLQIIKLQEEEENARNKYFAYHNYVMDNAEKGGKTTLQMVEKMKKLEKRAEKAHIQLIKACE